MPNYVDPSRREESSYRRGESEGKKEKERVWDQAGRKQMCEGGRGRHNGRVTPALLRRNVRGRILWVQGVCWVKEGRHTDVTREEKLFLVSAKLIHTYLFR